MALLTWFQNSSGDGSSGEFDSSSLDGMFVLKVCYDFRYLETADIQLFPRGTPFPWFGFELETNFATNELMICVTFCPGHYSCVMDIFQVTLAH